MRLVIIPIQSLKTREQLRDLIIVILGTKARERRVKDTRIILG